MANKQITISQSSFYSGISDDVRAISVSGFSIAKHKISKIML